MNTKIVFCGFFADFGPRDTFQEKSIETGKDKLGMKFSALKVDFEDPSLDFYVQGNLRTRASKSAVLP